MCSSGFAEIKRIIINPSDEPFRVGGVKAS